MKRILLSALIIIAGASPALAMSDECTSAWRTGAMAYKVALDEQTWFADLRAKAKAGTLQKSLELNAEIIKRDDAMLANINSVLISLRYMRKYNCAPAENAAIDAKIADVQSAYDDLKDERTQNEALKLAQ